MSSILMLWLKVLLLFGRAPLSTVGLIQRNKLPVYLMYPSLRFGEGMLRMTLPDYVAIGLLIVLIVWAVADWVPRGQL